jgi:pilus assembly protein CpaB
MSGRTIVVIGLALFCGLGAALGILWLPKQQAAPVIETKPVVFAIADIQRGEVIKETMLELRKVPIDQVNPGGLETLADAIDRSAHLPMLKGDVVSEAKLSPKGSGAGMAALIRPGMRAFTIQTPSLSSSLAGFLLPGNRVDVLFTITSSGDLDDRMGGAATTTLLQNIEILAVHTTVDTPAANKIDPNEARSVTLLVKPDEAALLDLGQNKGTLHLSLRNPQDAGNAVTKPATMADIQLPRVKKPASIPTAVAARPLPTPPPAPPRPSLTVRTLRGTLADVNHFHILGPSEPNPHLVPSATLAGGLSGAESGTSPPFPQP